MREIIEILTLRDGERFQLNVTYRISHGSTEECQTIFGLWRTHFPFCNFDAMNRDFDINVLSDKWAWNLFSVRSESWSSWERLWLGIKTWWGSWFYFVGEFLAKNAFRMRWWIACDLFTAANRWKRHILVRVALFIVTRRFWFGATTGTFSDLLTFSFLAWYIKMGQWRTDFRGLKQVTQNVRLK